MSILIVGSTGTVGSEITKQLAWRNGDVYALVKDPKEKVPNGVKTIQGDVTDICALFQVAMAYSGAWAFIEPPSRASNRPNR